MITEQELTSRGFQKTFIKDSKIFSYWRLDINDFLSIGANIVSETLFVFSDMFDSDIFISDDFTLERIDNLIEAFKS